MGYFKATPSRGVGGRSGNANEVFPESLISNCSSSVKCCGVLIFFLTPRFVEMCCQDTDIDLAV